MLQNSIMNKQTDKFLQWNVYNEIWMSYHRTLCINLIDCKAIYQITVQTLVKINYRNAMFSEEEHITKYMFHSSRAEKNKI